MRIDLRHRLVVVTGASSGIGAATASFLAGRGARVALVARDKGRLSEIARQITSEQGSASVYPANLGDAESTAALAADLLARDGLPDVLINNAGAGRWLTVEETPPDEVASMMAVPYFAAFNLTRAFLPGMRRRGSGSILNVTSVASRLVWPGATAYMAARCAMLSFSESLRAELEGSGVSVTTAILGTVDTPYWAHNPGSEQRLPRAGSNMRRLTADEAARALVGGIERSARQIVLPRVFRLIFLMNALAPRTTTRIMSRGWQWSREPDA
jgi:short-subunit dehydrogenase